MTSRLQHGRLGLSGDSGDGYGHDLPPDYDEATMTAPPLPAVPGYYDSNSHSGNHIHTGRRVRYTLRQCDRKTQMLAVQDQDNDGGPACPTYRITTNSSLRVFLSSSSRSSKKPDMEVLQTLPGMRLCQQRCLAGIWFDNDGGFPWRPRAHFDCTGDDGLSSRCHMEAVRFADWTVRLGGGRRLVWRLESRPVALVLGELENNDNFDSDMAVARFTFSSQGVRAHTGAAVGVLDVYCDRLAGRLGREGRDTVVCSVLVVITFFRRMGKNYSNQRVETERGC